MRRIEIQEKPGAVVLLMFQGDIEVGRSIHPYPLDDMDAHDEAFAAAMDEGHHWMGLLDQEG